MKQYYVQLIARHYITALVEAETEEEAYQIAHEESWNGENWDQETECFELLEIWENKDKEEFTLPIIRK